MAYEGIRYGKASIADGGTITHGLGKVPSSVQLTGSVAGTIPTVTSATSTTMTVALKAASTLTAAATQTVYWTVFA